MLNGGEEDNARMEGRHDEGVASSKKNEFKTRVQISVPCSLKEWRKNAYNQDTYL